MHHHPPRDVFLAVFGQVRRSIPDTVTRIGQAFAEQKLRSVTIPDSVTSIGGTAFFGNQLTSVIIGNKVETIEAQAFAYNRIQSVTLHDVLKIIGDESFYGNEIMSVSLPDTVEESARLHSAITKSPSFPSVIILEPSKRTHSRKISLPRLRSRVQ